VSIKRINGGRGSHSYRIDGKKADGVTTLIGGGMPKPALVNWAAKSVAEHVADNLDAVIGMRDMGRDSIINALKGTPWAQRDAAARRGTEVHKLADQLVHGNEVEVPEELAGHVQSCIKFLDDWQVRPVLTEFVVGHRRWRYCGTGDLVADIPNSVVAAFGCGTRPIIDWKTSRSGIFAETALQMAAYRHAEVYVDDDGAEKPLADVGITGALGVWIRADGYDVYEVDTGERVFKDFCHVAWVARTAWRMKDSSPIGHALTVPVEVAS
jgi:hypothetical protein